jgi:hypothetical protein
MAGSRRASVARVVVPAPRLGAALVLARGLLSLGRRARRTAPVFGLDVERRARVFLARDRVVQVDLLRLGSRHGMSSMSKKARNEPGWLARARDASRGSAALVVALLLRRVALLLVAVLVRGLAVLLLVLLAAARLLARHGVALALAGLAALAARLVLLLLALLFVRRLPALLVIAVLGHLVLLALS